MVTLIWELIDHLPANLHDFSRDSFGLANLLLSTGFAVDVLEHPSGPVRVTQALTDD